MTPIRTTLAAMATALGLTAGSAMAQWQPQKPVEFVVTAGAGGGTDIFARTVQAIVQKHNLMTQPIIVQGKGGGSGAEGYVYMKTSEGDAHKVVFGTHNLYVLSLGAKVAFTHNDLTPIAAMAFDEFLLWVKSDNPIKTAKDYIAAAKAKPDGFIVTGAQSKDSDELLTKLIEKAAGIKLTYVPFKSGAEADVQVSGGHFVSHVNNPSESIGSWKADKVRPLCVFNPGRLPAGPKVTATQGWSDIPSCRDEGIAVDSFTQPRIASIPGKVPAEAVAFWTELFKKVAATPEWKDYIDKSSQTGRTLTGDALKTFIAMDYDRQRAIFAEQNWLTK